MSIIKLTRIIFSLLWNMKLVIIVISIKNGHVAYYDEKTSNHIIFSDSKHISQLDL